METTPTQTIIPETHAICPTCGFAAFFHQPVCPQPCACCHGTKIGANGYACRYCSGSGVANGTFLLGLRSY